MNTQFKISPLMILLIIILSKTVFATNDVNRSHALASNEVSFIGEEDVKQQALKILQLKCNVCHKKQNPFMVFKEKNMEKRAPKINQMVFVERRMPKGNEIKLSKDEYTQLKNWLASLNIY